MTKRFSQPGSYVSIIKYVLIGVAFVGLVGWNADLQRRLADNRDSDQEAKHGNEHVDVHSRHRRDASSSRQGALSSGGAMFVRWGRRDCPNDDSELVYSGIVGASVAGETGGSAEYTCLTREAQYEKYTDALEGAAKIGGVEYYSYSSLFDTSKIPTGTVNGADAVCAVCRSKAKSSQLMIPGRKECYPGWKKEYWGYLMTGYFGNKAQYNWACVDNTPEGDEKGVNGVGLGYMYHVQGVCGSLPCPKYVNGRELTCVVCTK